MGGREPQGGDTARVGITGIQLRRFDGGLRRNKAFALAVAGAGVYDWQLYDTIYTERLVQTPQLNPQGYARTSSINAAKDLSGRLVLIHGTMDDNVHLQNNAVRVRLQKAGKDFEMMLYPKSRHGIGAPAQRAHLQRLTWRAIQETLLTKAVEGAGSTASAASTDAPAAATRDEKAIAGSPFGSSMRSAAQKIDRQKGNWRTQLPKPPVVEFPSGRSYFLESHDQRRRHQDPPDGRHRTCARREHDLSDAAQGFHDGLAFHRVIPGFMAQGGCPLGNGTGGPGYEYAGEFNAKARHDRAGLLQHGGGATDGSQFSLTFVRTPHLDDKHTIFGEVVAHMDTVKALEKVGSPSGRPTTKLEITSATMTWE